MNKKNYFRAALAALLIPVAAFAATTTFQTDTAKLGRPNSNNKDFIFDLNLGASNPRVRANGTTNKLQFSNDGTVYTDIGTGSGGGVGTNFLSDSNGQGFPSSGAWTTTSGTGTADTSVYTDGIQSMKVTASSQQSKLSQDVTPTIDMSGQNWQATMWVKTSLTNVQVCARVGGTATNCQAVSSANTWAPYTATFIGPASGSVGIEVSMTSSGTGTFNAQLGYVGKAVQTAMLSQAQLVGGVVVTGCAGNWTTSSTTFAAFAAQTGCSYAVFGSAQAPSTNIPGFKFATLPPGEYVIEYSGYAAQANNGIWQAHYQFSDGTNTAREDTVILGNQAGIGTIRQSISYTTANSNVTLQILSKVNNGSAESDLGGTSSLPGTFKLYRMPTQQDQGYRADATPASWSGYHGASGSQLWSTSSASFADPGSNSSFSLTELSNRNFGTVSSYGGASTLPGLVLTFPRAGKYFICAMAQGYSSSTASFNKMQLTDGTTPFAFGQVVVTNNTNVPLCGVYTASAATSTTIKLQMLASGGGTSFLQATASSPAINWSIVELDAPMPAPYLMGSVTSNTSAQERVERAFITNNGSTCAVSSQSGSWISSVSRNATGSCAITITSGEFSATPACACSDQDGIARACGVVSSSSTSVTSKTTVNGTTAEDGNLTIICMGPR